MTGRDPQKVMALLRQVSRSFYLTLRVLPGAVRYQIGLAYLLARAADTIADTRLVSVERRLSALRDLKNAIRNAAEGRVALLPPFGDLSAAQEAPAGEGSPAERTLLEEVVAVLDLLRELPQVDRGLVGEVLEIIIRGQETDLIRFQHGTGQLPAAFETDAELDQYTYCVAGCVGEFWTRMCRAHLFPEARLDDSFLLSAGVRFGKGLQLVNILRDVPGDLRRGRCYIPSVSLAKHGLKPLDLRSAASMARFRPLYGAYLKDAADHLEQGWAYTATLPYGQVRVRLACAWPVLIGMETIALLRRGNVLDDRQRIKVNRMDIRRLILRTVLLYPFPSIWQRLFDSASLASPR